MMNFVRSKYLPYALGIICAVMIYLIYMITQINGYGLSLFSEAMMGDAAILLMLIDLIPLFMERIIYTHEHNDITGLKLMHYVKVIIMCIAFVCSVLSLVYMFIYDYTGKINLFYLFGRTGCVITTGGFALLMISTKLKSRSLVQVCATASLAGVALMGTCIHLMKLIVITQEIIQTATVGEAAFQVIFYVAFANLMWLLCLFLADAGVIYLSACALKRNARQELPLEYL